MNEKLFLFATIAGTRVAIPTEEIEAVVHLGEIVPIARAAPFVRGLAALRSRVLTVVDTQARISGTLSDISNRPLAIVAEIENHSYGFIVDAVSDALPIPDGTVPLRGRIDPLWQPFAHGMIHFQDHSHLVLAVQDFIKLQNAALAA